MTQRSHQDAVTRGFPAAACQDPQPPSWFLAGRRDHWSSSGVEPEAPLSTAPVVRSPSPPDRGILIIAPLALGAGITAALLLGTPMEPTSPRSRAQGTPTQTSELAEAPSARALQPVAPAPTRADPATSATVAARPSGAPTEAAGARTQHAIARRSLPSRPSTASVTPHPPVQPSASLPNDHPTNAVRTILIRPKGERRTRPD